MMREKIFAGERLKRLREKQSLKQSELARLACISPSYLNQIESDQRPLTSALLTRLAAILNVPEISFGDSDELRARQRPAGGAARPGFRQQGSAGRGIAGDRPDRARIQ